MIIIPRSVSGGGKDTLIHALANNNRELAHNFYAGAAARALLDYVLDLRTRTFGKTMAMVSADSFYMVGGAYKFDPALLSKAHGQCLRNFTEVLIDFKEKPNDVALIVNNTNCSIAEVAPYAAQANAFGHELHIITLLVDPMIAYLRNTHDTPITHVVKQDLVLRQSILEWPPWWPQVVFPS